MNNDLKVTIAIPAYNEANHIDSVIKGFLNQNHPNLIRLVSGELLEQLKITLGLEFRVQTSPSSPNYNPQKRSPTIPHHSHQRF